MPSRKLIVEIIGDSTSLDAALGRAAAASTGFVGTLKSKSAELESVGKSMMTHVTLPIAAIGAVSTKAAIDFQNSMELLHTQAGVSQKAVESLSKAVLGMAGDVATTPDVLSQGLYHLASQGLRGKDALDALHAAAEGARLGQANLEDVTNALGAVIVSKIGGIKSYEQAMGELNATVGSGDMRMEQLAEAMGTGLAAKAAVAHVSLTDINAALAVFGDNNIRGAKAGTLLASTLRVMEGPSDAAAKHMAEAGVSASRLGALMTGPGGLVSAIQYLQEKLSGLSAHQKFEDLTQMFGSKQAGGVMILIDELERLKTKEREVSQGGADFAKDWNAYTQTAAFRANQLGASMSAAGISIGNILLPFVSRLADFVSSLATKFEALPGPIKDFIVAGAGVLAVIGPLVYSIGALGTAITFLAANPIVLAVAGIAALAAVIAAAVLAPQKLKSALEDMGLSAQTAGKIVADLQQVFQVVKAAAEALAPFIENTWRTIASTISADMQIIRGIVEVVTGLIHGNWSRVWQGLQDIAGGVMRGVEAMLRGAVTALGDLAKLAGEAVYRGIVQPLGRLASAALNAIKDAIASAIRAVASWVVGAAGSIGKAVTEGVLGGIGGLAGSLADKLKGAAGGALSSVKSFLHIGSPSRVFAEQVGKPIADGIIAGYLEGANGLPPKLTASVRAALEQAKKQVEQYRSQFQSAFSELIGNVNQAIGGSVSASQTSAGKQLAALQAAHDAAQLQQALQQAQEQLASDQTSGADASTITADQQAVADAQYNIQVAALQKAAAAQAKSESEMHALKKREADRALKELEQRLAKEGATQKQAQDAIVKLLRKYGVTYHDVAADMGKKFAQGLESSIHLTAKAAEELAREIAKYLPHSPAEKGPLSRPVGWANYLLPGLTGAVGSVNGVMGGLSGASAGLGGSRAGGPSVTVNVQGSLVGATPSQIADELKYPIRDALLTIGRSEPSIFHGRA